MKYPSGTKFKKTVSYSKRGMSLEHDINEANNYYLVNDIAVIYKKPTPITITKVDYPSRASAVIKEAYFNVPSTTDYNGLYKGRYIDFEAKETKQNYFPLANIHHHQIEHLKNIMNNKGIGFLIVRFTLINKTYLLETKYLLDFIKNSDRKSIPLDYFENYGYIIKEKYNPRVDYIEILEIIYKGEFL